MRAIIAALFAASLAAAQAPQVPQVPGPPPGTDLYLLPMSSGLAGLKAAKPSPVSTAAGYDNQPYFSPDGNRVLFAANRDGKQTDVFVFNRDNGRVAQLTQTPENENSPTYVPAGVAAAGAFTVVRTEPPGPGKPSPGPIQRLWRFDAQGGNPQLVLTDINPVGYHAWMDDDRLVLFVLGAQGKPNTLQIASVKTGKGEVVAEGIGRSLHRIPGTNLASFVHREPSGEFWIKQIDTTSKKIDLLARVVEGNNERDYAWMPDGKTIVMSAGTKLFAWTRGAAGWTEVFDGAAHQLGALSRLAVSPKGDAIVIVAAELRTPV